YKRNISDRRHRRPFVLRLFGFMQGRLALRLGGCHRFKLLALLAQSRLRLFFACADEVELQVCGLGRTLRPTRRPGISLKNIVARQQPVRWSSARLPLDCTLKVAGVLAQPIEVSVESGDQFRKAGAEARTRHLGLLVEKGVVKLPQARWRAHALQRSGDTTC